MARNAPVLVEPTTQCTPVRQVSRVGARVGIRYVYVCLAHQQRRVADENAVGIIARFFRTGSTMYPVSFNFVMIMMDTRLDPVARALASVVFVNSDGEETLSRAYIRRHLKLPQLFSSRSIHGCDSNTVSVNVDISKTICSQKLQHAGQVPLRSTREPVSGPASPHYVTHSKRSVGATSKYELLVSLAASLFRSFESPQLIWNPHTKTKPLNLKNFSKRMSPLCFKSSTGSNITRLESYRKS